MNDATYSRIVSFLEYRTRLVADVVTGKLDVRAAAAALPDEPADEVPDDPDDLTPDDAEDVGDDTPETDAA